LLHSIVLYHVTIENKIENLALDGWFLLTQLKKYAGVRKNIVRGQLARYSEQLPHSTEVSRSVRIQAVAASKKPNTSSGYMGNMQQTAWRMCLSKHRT